MFYCSCYCIYHCSRLHVAILLPQEGHWSIAHKQRQKVASSCHLKHFPAFSRTKCAQLKHPEELTPLQQAIFHYSHKKRVLGVPQGLILGPIHFTLKWHRVTFWLKMCIYTSRISFTDMECVITHARIQCQSYSNLKFNLFLYFM